MIHGPNGRLVAIILLLSLRLPVPRAWAVAPEVATAGAVTLTIRVIDGDSGRLLPARLDVVGSNGVHQYPPPRNSRFFHQSYTGMSYFYTDGEVSLAVPPGRTVVRVMHGFEYVAVSESLDVEDDTSLEVTLLRMVDMPALGFRSGDNHIHLSHGGLNLMNLTDADMFLMQRAEDLGVASVLENGIYFTGDVSRLSTADHLLFFGVEYRSGFWGHLDVLGTSALTRFNCCSVRQPAFPMNVDLYDAARGLGGTVIFAHPITLDRSDLSRVDQGWPSVGHGRELPIDVALGRVDAMDVASYSNRTGWILGTWYDLLNHGFHIPGTAGTDASMNRFRDPPLGGYRVYAQVGPGSFTYGEWLEALRAGNCFVTTGPLITRFEVAGHPMGSTALMDSVRSRDVFCVVEAVSQWPIWQVRIVVNGWTRGYLYPNGNSRSVAGGLNVTLEGRSGWVAAVVEGSGTNPFTSGEQIMAHTNPVYIQVPNRPLRFGGPDPGYYLGWIDEVASLAVNRGFAAEEDRLTLESRCALARKIILSRTVLASVRPVDPDPPDPELPATGAAVASGRPEGIRVEPNPSRGPLAVTFGADPGVPESLEIFDVCGRRLLTRRLDQTAIADGRWTWDPAAAGVDLAPGVYFARFLGPAWARTVRIIRVR